MQLDLFFFITLEVNSISGFDLAIIVTFTELSRISCNSGEAVHACVYCSPISFDSFKLMFRLLNYFVGPIQYFEVIFEMVHFNLSFIRGLLDSLIF